jgi:hypothetical protein
MLKYDIIKTSGRVEEYIHAFLTVGASPQYSAWRTLRDVRDAVAKRQCGAVPRIELTLSVCAGSKLVTALSHSHVQIPLCLYILQGSSTQLVIMYYQRITQLHVSTNKRSSSGH